MFPHSSGFPVEKAVSASRTDSSRGGPAAVLKRLLATRPPLQASPRCAPARSLDYRSPIARLRWATARRTDRDSISQRERSAFTLLELLIVIGIIALLMVLVVPAFTNIKSAGDVTSAAYTVKGVLDTARTYAKANNTYTWVGFYEENVSNPASPNSDTPKVGRLIMSIVASKDGTIIYDPNATGTNNFIDPTRLVQVTKLAKIENVHLPLLPCALQTVPETHLIRALFSSSTLSASGITARDLEN